jgi:hypothetical protein
LKLTLRLEIDEANSASAELEISPEDMKIGNQDSVLEDIRMTWVAIRGSYMARTHGPKWYMKELKETVEKSGAVWRS